MRFYQPKLGLQVQSESLARLTKFGSVLLFIFVFSVAGCATVPIAVTYSPSSSVSGEGNIEVSKFAYVPALQNRASSNQIMNTAAGSIYLIKPVADFIQEAFAAELKFAGFKLNPGSHQLKGTIFAFVCDDLGFKVDWELALQIELIDSTGKVVDSFPVRIQRSLQKGNDFNSALNVIIKMAFEETYRRIEHRLKAKSSNLK